METVKTFWKNVEKECKNQGISLKELSEKMGYESINFGMDIPLSAAMEISDILGVYISCLVEDGDLTMEIGKEILC